MSFLEDFVDAPLILICLGSTNYTEVVPSDYLLTSL